MFIKLLLEYVRYNFKSTKEQFPDINDKTLKSALVYRYVHFYYLERDISIYEILEIEGSDSLGLIGPGSGRLTRLLEFIFGWSDVFSNHAILHDAFDPWLPDYSIGACQFPSASCRLCWRLRSRLHPNIQTMP